MSMGTKNSDGLFIENITSALDDALSKIKLTTPTKSSAPISESTVLLSDLSQRIQSISTSIELTAKESASEVERAVHLFRKWMVNGAIVRVIGAGRAKLAGSMPANRLAHGGARVYIQDDIIPMPHSIKGGGIIAVSASGRTRSVLSVLEGIRQKAAMIKVVGIADNRASQFRDLCDIFIGIHLTELHNPLQALADTEEFIISMLLDAMVVFAGKLAGFDDTTWRLGHEDIGPTGPYGAPTKSDVDLTSQPITSLDLHKSKQNGEG